MKSMTLSIASRGHPCSDHFARVAGILCLAFLAGALLMAGCSKGNNEASLAQDASTGMTYTLGRKVSFGEAGDSERFRVSGWSHTEKEITWTEGNSAVLNFTGLPVSTSLRLKMTLAGFTNSPRLVSQPVEVYAEGHKIADWEVSDKADFQVFIPPNTVPQGGSLKIELRVPKAASPKELGVSTDPRILGVCCFDLVIDKVG
jgi:hypothetical protein